MREERGRCPIEVAWTLAEEARTLYDILSFLQLIINKMPSNLKIKTIPSICWPIQQITQSIVIYNWDDQKDNIFKQTHLLLEGSSIQLSHTCRKACDFTSSVVYHRIFIRNYAVWLSLADGSAWSFGDAGSVCLSVGVVSSWFVLSSTWWLYLEF
jgi:hypothetical protein